MFVARVRALARPDSSCVPRRRYTINANLADSRVRLLSIDAMTQP